MKLCKNCKWCKPLLFVIYSSVTCNHPLASTANVVTGECFASLEREFGECGELGILWNTDEDGS